LCTLANANSERITLDYCVSCSIDSIHEFITRVKEEIHISLKSWTNFIETENRVQCFSTVRNVICCNNLQTPDQINSLLIPPQYVPRSYNSPRSMFPGPREGLEFPSVDILIQRSWLSPISKRLTGNKRRRDDLHIPPKKKKAHASSFRSPCQAGVDQFL
jgi:hypothetical protein